MKNIKHLLLVALITAVFIGFAFPSISKADAQKTIIWNDYFDWLLWTKTNVSVAAGALRLRRSQTGYAQNGNALYEFNPGNGENSWKSASYIRSSVPSGSNNSIGTLNIAFSADNSSWFSAEQLTQGNVPDSDSLFIKADFNGDGTFSPVLNSITLSYLSKQDARILLEKGTFNDSVSFQNASSTFVPGDRVITRIKIDPMRLNGLSLHIRDYRPKAALIEQIKSASECGLNTGQTLLTVNDGDFAANEESGFTDWSNVDPGQAVGFLCYKYAIDQTKQAKNDLVQAKVQAFDQYSYNSDQPHNGLMATYSSYLLVKGFASLSDGLTAGGLFPIEDVLSLTRTVAYFTSTSGRLSSLNYSPSYIYKTGQGPKSRGGQLLSLPVKMQNDSSQVVAVDQSYLLYNPAYYLFGNVFSGSQSNLKNLDFSSSSNAISDQNNSLVAPKNLNSEAALYNYNFDRQSILYWDSTNEQKNDRMSQSIDKLISADPRPDIVCNLSQSDLSGGNYFLDNKNCQIMSSSDKIWPNGRVWYLRADAGTSQIDLNGKVNGRGTLIVDFGAAGGVPVLNLKSLDFASGASLGIILVGGGNVNFATECSSFNGLIFAPGKAGAENQGGEITFQKDGATIKINGSLVASKVNFNPRSKDAFGYAVSISANQALLNAPLPGFDSISSVIFGP